MSNASFLRWSVWVPLVAPLVGWYLAALVPTELTVAIGTSLIGGLIYAGLPYLLFASAIVLWARGRSLHELRRCAWFAPVLFAPLAGLGFVAFLVITFGALTATGAFEAWAQASSIALIIGYLYCGVILGLVAVLTRMGWLSEFEPRGA